MKKAVLFILIFLLILPYHVFGGEEDMLSDILSQLRTDELETYTNDEKFHELFGYTDPVSFISDIIKGESPADMNLWEAFRGYITHNLRTSLKPVLGIFILGILSIFVKNLSVEYLSKDISSAVGVLITMFVAGSVSGMFFESVSEVTEVTKSLSTLLGTVCPALLILISMAGGTATAGFVSPALMLALGYGEMFITSIIIPLSAVMFILSVADSVTDGINLKKLTDLIKKSATVSLGVAFTVISAIISTAGLTFSGADNLIFKAAKYAAGNLIPVVGSFLSSSAETVFSLLYAVKGGFGLLGILIVISLISGPVIKLFSVYAALKVSSALISVFSDDRVSDIIDKCASCMGFLLSLNVAVGVMSVMIISILINISGAVV